MSRRQVKLRAPGCAFSMAQLKALRVQARALCVERGWAASRLYDALQELATSDAGVASGFWVPVARPAKAVPLDVEADRRFVAQLLDAERDARALNALPVQTRRGQDVPGIGLSFSAEERTVAAIEDRHRNEDPQQSQREGFRAACRAELERYRQHLESRGEWSVCRPLSKAEYATYMAAYFAWCERRF